MEAERRVTDTMKKADVKVGHILAGKSDEELKKPFQGQVEKVYDHSALLEITAYDKADASAVSDLNNKIVVNFKNLKPTKAVKNSKIAPTNQIKIEKIKPTMKKKKRTRRKKRSRSKKAKTTAKAKTRKRKSGKKK